jgi:hypothetical protein
MMILKVKSGFDMKPVAKPLDQGIRDSKGVIFPELASTVEFKNRSPPSVEQAAVLPPSPSDDPSPPSERAIQKPPRHDLLQSSEPREKSLGVPTETSLEEIAEAAFHALLQEALADNKPLALKGKTVVLTETVKLRRRDSLTITGGTLVGQAHSIFSLGTDRNPKDPISGLPSYALTLRGCSLKHLKASEDKRQVGAVVFVMGKAVVRIEDCTLSSVEGFGLW